MALEPSDTDATAMLPGYGARKAAPQEDPAPVRGAALGRYLVVGEAGTGGMGLVLRAYDPKLRREIALKRLRFVASGSDDAAGPRLLREARAMARISGFALVSAGRPAEAVGLLQRAVEIREAALPAEHPDLATSLNNLGNARAAAGDVAGARIALTRALAIRERALGDDHPHTLATRERAAELDRSARE